MHALVITQGRQADIDAVRLEHCLRQIAQQYSHVSLLLPVEALAPLKKAEITKLRIPSSIDVYHSTSPRLYGMWLRMLVARIAGAKPINAVFFIQADSVYTLKTVKRLLPAVPLVYIRLAYTKKVSNVMFMLRFLREDSYIRSVQLVLTDSMHVAATAKRRANPEAVHYVPSIPAEQASITAVMAPPVAWDVSMVTPLLPGSGIDAVLEAATRIPHCRVLIIGDGPDRYRLERKIISLALEGKVQLTGWFPKLSEVIASIKSTRIFVMNSSHLQSQYALIQAMMSMVPVLALRTEFTAGLLTDYENGIYTTGTSADIERKLRWYIDHEPKRMYITEKAYADTSQFTPDAVQRAWQKALQRL